MPEDFPHPEHETCNGLQPACANKTSHYLTSNQFRAHEDSAPIASGNQQKPNNKMMGLNKKVIISKIFLSFASQEAGCEIHLGSWKISQGFLQLTRYWLSTEPMLWIIKTSWPWR
jgi:hypothetical protein